MIEVENLRKTFGDFTAVKEISFTAERGKIFGLLGPNGAGKSTTIGCISGLLKPTEGHVRILGHDVVQSGAESRRKLGVVPQELALYEDLSSKENLMYWGAAYGMRGEALISRCNEVLAQIGLLDRSVEPAKNFSGGMKRRLNFGCALMHQPEVLLLDEPTVGVDPQSREKLLELVREQVSDGMCVLYTTHYMEEAELLCDKLAIVDAGEIIAMGTLDELRGMLGERDLVRLEGEFEPAAITSALSAERDVEVLLAEEEALQLAVRKASEQISSLFEVLGRTGAEIRETIITQPNLETLFIKLTGKELRE